MGVLVEVKSKSSRNGRRIKRDKDVIIISGISMEEVYRDTWKMIKKLVKEF